MVEWSSGKMSGLGPDDRVRFPVLPCCHVSSVG